MGEPGIGVSASYSSLAARNRAYDDLGAILAEPTTVSSGLLHQMWKIETTRRFAIKQFNPEAVSRPGAGADYLSCESTARAMVRAGIPAMTSPTR